MNRSLRLFNTVQPLPMGPLSPRLCQPHKPHQPIKQGAVTVPYGTAFLQVVEQAVRMKKSSVKVSAKALLSSVRKEMKGPRKATSVRASEARQAKEVQTKRTEGING
jgi:hypothetical protein